MTSGKFQPSGLMGSREQQAQQPPAQAPRATGMIVESEGLEGEANTSRIVPVAADGKLPQGVQGVDDRRTRK